MGSDAASVSPRREAATVLLDVGLIGVVFLWGLHTHGTAFTDMPGHAVRTALPFILGWLICAPLAGVYGRRRPQSVRGTLAVTSIAWLGASAVGALLRATAIFPGESPWVFVAVVAGFGALVLLPWRALDALARHA